MKFPGSLRQGEVITFDSKTGTGIIRIYGKKHRAKDFRFNAEGYCVLAIGRSDQHLLLVVPKHKDARKCLPEIGRGTDVICLVGKQERSRRRVFRWAVRIDNTRTIERWIDMNQGAQEKQIERRRQATAVRAPTD